MGGQRTGLLAVQRADTGELVGFLANALQAGVTGAKAQGEQWSTIILAACRIGMRRFETEVRGNPIGDSPIGNSSST